MAYSEEQRKIIESTEDRIEVASPPGSGKTFTILGIVKHHKKQHHLILAFNSAIREAIRRKIDDECVTNAEVFTFHGLAYDFFKSNNQIVEFEKRSMVNLDYFSLEQLLSDLKVKMKSKEITPLLELLLRFLRGGSTFKDFFSDVSQNQRDLCAKILHHIRKDPTSPMFHEYYIKMFQLINYSNDRYHTVLVDESQDKTSCYEKIISNLNPKRVIHFGDNQQKIYAYNGAVGMGDSKYKLTKSFRIGKQHSDICNALIEDITKDNSSEFEGVNPKGVIVDKLSCVDKRTVICRTNKEIMKRMLEEIKKNKLVHLVGGGGINYELVKDIFEATVEKPKWFKGKKITSINDAVKLYALSKSQELKTALDFVTEHGVNTIKVINTIKTKTIEDPKLADISLVTAHRAKGLEFECVEITDDFPLIDTIKEKKLTGEIYALYVALSRCTGKMMLNRNLKLWYANYINGTIKDPELRYDMIEDLF